MRNEVPSKGAWISAEDVEERRRVVFSERGSKRNFQRYARSR